MYQVREHAAAVLAGLMKGGDEDLAKDFRDKAYTEAAILQRKRKRRYFPWLLKRLVFIVFSLIIFWSCIKFCCFHGNSTSLLGREMI